MDRAERVALIRERWAVLQTRRQAAAVAALEDALATPAAGVPAQQPHRSSIVVKKEEAPVAAARTRPAIRESAPAVPQVTGPQRRALTALAAAPQGLTLAEMPDRVGFASLRPLRRAGLVSYDDGRWYITPAGQEVFKSFAADFPGRAAS